MDIEFSFPIYVDSNRKVYHSITVFFVISTFKLHSDQIKVALKDMNAGPLTFSEEQRVEATIITTNLPFTRWKEVL